MLPGLKNILIRIKNYINNQCGALKSMPNVYNFKENISLSKLINEINLSKGEIKFLVLNYNGKVIGVKVKLNKLEGFFSDLQWSLDCCYGCQKLL